MGGHEVPHGPGLELEQQPGGVVEGLAGQHPVAEGTNPADRAEEVVEGVDHVNAEPGHAAQRALVLRGSPGRREAAAHHEDRRRQQQRAETPFVDHGTDATDRGQAAPLMAHHQHGPGVRRGGHGAPPLGGAQRERLVHQYTLAGGRNLADLGTVGAVRRRQHDALHVLGGNQLRERRGRPAAPGLGEGNPGGLRAGIARHHLGCAAAGRGVGEFTAPPAQTDDPQPDRLVPIAHSSSLSSYSTRDRTTGSPSVTRTMSSIRTPPPPWTPGTQTRGSTAKTMPGRNSVTVAPGMFSPM